MRGTLMSQQLNTKLSDLRLRIQKYGMFQSTLTTKELVQMHLQFNTKVNQNGMCSWDKISLNTLCHLFSDNLDNCDMQTVQTPCITLLFQQPTFTFTYNS